MNSGSVISTRRTFITLLAIVIGSQAAADTRVSTELLADASAISRGDAFRVGILFRIPEHAHIYWHNPGDSGLPTSIEWTAPEGFRVEDLQWPNPTAFYDDILNETSFGYEQEVLLFATVRAPYGINPGDSVAIAAKAVWLICLEDGQCIPEDATHEMTISVGEGLQPSPSAAVFDAYATRTPGSISQTGLPLKITIAGQPNPSVKALVTEPWRFDLTGRAPSFYPDRGGNWFMTDDTESLEDAAEVQFIPAGKVDGYTSGALTLPLVDAESGENRTVHVRFGARPRD